MWVLCIGIQSICVLWDIEACAMLEWVVTYHWDISIVNMQGTRSSVVLYLEFGSCREKSQQAYHNGMLVLCTGITSICVLLEIEACAMLEWVVTYHWDVSIVNKASGEHIAVYHRSMEKPWLIGFKQTPPPLVSYTNISYYAWARN